MTDEQIEARAWALINEGPLFLAKQIVRMDEALVGLIERVDRLEENQVVLDVDDIEGRLGAVEASSERFEDLQLLAFTETTADQLESLEGRLDRLEERVPDPELRTP